MADSPVVLQETNNTVVWLRPHAIIAKVGKWRHSADCMMREHAVAAALAADNAPIAAPVAGAAPTLDEETGFIVTLWQRLLDDDERVVTPGDIGGTLRELHHSLANYQGHLPSFEVSLDRARAALADDASMAALPTDDRAMLREAFDRLRQKSRTQVHHAEQPLHGEAHRGNLLATPVGLRWIDLEDACMGPLEWDLASLPTNVADLFPKADRKLLDLLRTLNSARVATWCWMRADIREMRRHGEYHLDVVRSRSTDRHGM